MRGLDAIISEIREELTGNFPLEKTVNKVTGDKDASYKNNGLEKEFSGDETKRMREVVIQITNLFFHNELDEVIRLQKFWQVPQESFRSIVQLGFDLCLKFSQYEICYYAVEKFPIDNHRAAKAIQALINKLFVDGRLKKAAEIWNAYKDSDIPLQGTETIINIAFKRVMQFPVNIERRDYSKAFLMAKLFNLSKNSTFSLSTREYEYNYKRGYYYVAAQIAQKLKMPYSMVHRAVLGIHNKFIKIFIEKLENGEYGRFSQIRPDDPYIKARNAVLEFDSYDFEDKNGRRDALTIKAIASTSQSILEKLLEENSYSANSDTARITFILRLIIDYSLLNNKILIKASKIIEQKISWLMRWIISCIKDENSAKYFHPLLVELYGQTSLDHIYYRDVSEMLFLRFIEAKNLKKAKQVFKEFGMYLENISHQLGIIAWKWVEQGDFDFLINTLEDFNVLKELEKNKSFKEKILNYYKKSIKDQRPIKSSVISKLFSMKRDFAIAPYVDLIIEKLDEKDIDQAFKIYRDNRLKRKESMDFLIKQYKKHLPEDKEYAIRLRQKFAIRISDIGLIKWIIFEIFGVNPKKSKKK